MRSLENQREHNTEDAASSLHPKTKGQWGNSYGASLEALPHTWSGVGRAHILSRRPSKEGLRAKTTAMQRGTPALKRKTWSNPGKQTP